MKPTISKRKQVDRNEEIYKDTERSVGTDGSADLEIFSAIQEPISEQVSIVIQSRYYWFFYGDTMVKRAQIEINNAARGRMALNESN